MLLFASGCVSEQVINKAKFADLRSIAQDLKTAISSTDPCGVPEALQDRLASGIAAVKGRANSHAEKDLVAAYSSLLSTYKDGLLLCRSRHQLSSFDFFPKGRIYVSQELDPLVERYDLPVEKHLYKHTGEYIKSIDGNSIEVIWERARIQLRNIENMIDYS
jgi:hypothetical protein